MHLNCKNSDLSFVSLAFQYCKYLPSNKEIKKKLIETFNRNRFSDNSVIRSVDHVKCVSIGERVDDKD